MRFPSPSDSRCAGRRCSPVSRRPSATTTPGSRLGVQWRSSTVQPSLVIDPSLLHDNSIGSSAPSADNATPSGPVVPEYATPPTARTSYWVSVSNLATCRYPSVASTSISQASSLPYGAPTPSVTQLLPFSSTTSQNSEPLATRNRGVTVRASSCRGARLGPATKGTADDGGWRPVLAPTPPGRSATLMHSAATAVSTARRVDVAAAAANGGRGISRISRERERLILRVQG